MLRLETALTGGLRRVLPPGRWPVLLAGTLFVGGLASSLIVATLLRNEARVSPELVWWLTLAIGAVLAGFVTALVVTRGRGRGRALGLVEEKTGQLRHQALHDTLTGLPNRVLALDRAEQLLARARREHASMAVLFLDLDGFKAVNDAYGHAAGDELLRTVAERLKLTIRASDTAARLGGDEFVVLVSGSLDVGPELVAERVLEVLRQPYQIAGRSRTLTASIGVATGFRAGAEELLRDADIALSEAKEAGGDRYVVFRSEMQTVVQDRLTLEMDLAGALERGEFFLAYQPMIALHSGAIIGAEALIRWQHPERGELVPGAFIPLAEKSGTIVSIGRWVLDEASLQAARWNNAGHRLSLAVNLAARQLDGDQLLDDVRNALEHSGLNAERLWLEVTETTLMRDPAASARRMHGLKELGVKIAIDDFGTGYSSLAYLQRFPADLVKIDRSFVQAASRSQDSSALVHTLVQLGASLRLATIAEGIEEQDQLDAVLRQNCDYGQGYLFSRPVPPEKLEELLTLTRSHRRSARAAASGNAGAK